MKINEDHMKDFLILFREYNRLIKFITKIRIAEKEKYFSINLLRSYMERKKYIRFSNDVNESIFKIISINNEKFNKILYLMIVSLFSSRYCHESGDGSILFKKYRFLTETSASFMTNDRPVFLENLQNIIEVIDSNEEERRNKFIYFLLTF